MTEQIDDKDDLNDDTLEGAQGDDTIEAGGDPDLQAEAKKYGWRPLSEFDKNPDGWVDAERFLSMPSTQVKMFKDRDKERLRELKERDDRLARMEGMAESVAKRIRDQERAAYEAKIADLERQRRDAASDADLERFDKLTRDVAAIKPPAQEPSQAAPAGPTPEVAEYLGTVPWGKDKEVLQFAARLIDADETAPFLSPTRQLKWVEKRIKDSGYFPDYFDNPAPQTNGRQTTSRVDGGGLGGAFAGKGKGAADLPPDVRKVGESYVREGVYKSVDEYAKDYFAQG